MNKLFLGDCFNVIRGGDIETESVDLIYIDPPFNSKRNYSIFFDDAEIQTQHVAFEDTWSLKNIQDSLAELHTLQTEKLYDLLEAYRKAAPHAFPYLVMMGLRIVELHKLLKSTGSFYLHCDPTMSHYLKSICDLIFGAKYFRNEIVWKRSTAHNDSSKYGSLHDIILYYTKSDKYTFNSQYEDYDESYIKTYYRYKDARGVFLDRDLSAKGLSGGGYSYEWKGKAGYWRCPIATMQKYEKDDRIYYTKNNTPRLKQYLHEMPGVPVSDIWTDINAVNSQAQERLGYPTQKPLALLERIINTSSNKGDLVLDAFCGCGTTVDASEHLHREWIGVDISPIAISLIKNRLKNTYKEDISQFTIRGIPEDYPSAVELWKQNPNAFQDWWVMEFDALSPTYGTSGSDKGVDGIALYKVDNAGGTIKIAFQVKGGSVGSKDMDALLGAMEKHKCEAGVFLTIEPVTKPMRLTVAGLKPVKTPSYTAPRVQVLTLKEFFNGERPKLPAENITFARARFKNKRKDRQITLILGNL